MNQINEIEYVSKQGHVLKASRMANGKTLKYSGPWMDQAEEITVLDCTLERFMGVYDVKGSYYTVVRKQ